MRKFGIAVLFVAATLFLNAEPASARIYCSSYSFTYLTTWEVCHVTCVYCINDLGEQLSEYCSEECWSRIL